MPGSHWPEMSQIGRAEPPGVPGAAGVWPARRGGAARKLGRARRVGEA